MGIFDSIGDIFTGGADSSANTLKTGIAQARANTDKNYGSIKDLWTPYTGIGQNAAGQLPGYLGQQPGLGRTAADYGANNAQPGVYQPGQFQGQQGFKPQAFNYQASPGRASQLADVTDAVQKSAAARGMLGSTNTTKQLANQVGNVVAQDYGNEFNRNLQTNQQGLQAQGQNFNQGLQGYDANLAAQQHANDLAVQQGNVNRNFGENQYQFDLNNFQNQNQQQYGRLLDTLGLGQRGAAAQQGQIENYNNNINDLTAQRANATAAATKAKYGAVGKFFDPGGYSTTQADGSKSSGTGGIASLFSMFA